MVPASRDPSLLTFGGRLVQKTRVPEHVSVHQMDCSTVRTLVEKVGNVIVGPVQLTFLTFPY